MCIRDSVYGTRARAVVERMRATPALAEPMQPDLPYVWAEVAFAAEEELAQTVEDVLVRRVPLMLVGLDQGLDVAERTADILAERDRTDQQPAHGSRIPLRAMVSRR